MFYDPTLHTGKIKTKHLWESKMRLAYCLILQKQKMWVPSAVLPQLWVLFANLEHRSYAIHRNAAFALQDPSLQKKENKQKPNPPKANTFCRNGQTAIITLKAD